MSCNYAEGLSPYHDKGKLGLKEIFHSEEIVKANVSQLAEWISISKHVVVHTGAGISTSAGIPDFRGPRGVWTLESKGEKPNINVSFNDAVPTKTHMALVALVKAGKVHFVVSQNIDGLHLRSGLPRANLAELHGNMFIDQCNQCESQFVRHSATSSVGQKSLGVGCPNTRLNGRPCRGRLHDTILDWEHSLPEKELALSDFHSCVADLSICLGTTLQIVPSGNLPLNTKRHGECGRLVICNLQPTKHDKKADLLIRTYVDDVMEGVCRHLGISIPAYSPVLDPTNRSDACELIPWTISNAEVKRMRKLYESVCRQGKKTTKSAVKDTHIQRVKKDRRQNGSSVGKAAPTDTSSNDERVLARSTHEEAIKDEIAEKKVKVEELGLVNLETTDVDVKVKNECPENFQDLPKHENADVC